MDVKTFQSLKCIDNLTQLVNPEIGDLFLNGNAMINQKEIKNIGNEISWYEVVDVKNNGQISYVPRYGKIQKSKMEEGK